MLGGRQGRLQNPIWSNITKGLHSFSGFLGLATNYETPQVETGKAYMGWWGDMGGPKQKAVSPMRQASMRGVVSHWAINGYKRLMSQAIYFVAPFAVGYGLLKWAIADNHIRNSKQGIMLGKLP